MNKNRIANRQVICDVLMQRAEQDPSLVVLCSDSRGSASLTPFAEKYPSRFVEAGIAEQDLVGIAAGLASCGKRPFAAACKTGGNADQILLGDTGFHKP